MRLSSTALGVSPPLMVSLQSVLLHIHEPDKSARRVHIGLKDCPNRRNIQIKCIQSQTVTMMENKILWRTYLSGGPSLTVAWLWTKVVNGWKG